MRLVHSEVMLKEDGPNRRLQLCEVLMGKRDENYQNQQLSTFIKA